MAWLVVVEWLNIVIGGAQYHCGCVSKLWEELTEVGVAQYCCRCECSPTICTFLELTAVIC